MSLAEPRSPSVRTPVVETPRQSISNRNGTDSSKAAIDKEYLRNVLVQFFEHKEKRVSFLRNLGLTMPVSATARIVNAA